MLAIKLYVYLLILYNSTFTYDLKSCSDCMEVHLCPEVNNWSREEVREKLKQSKPICRVRPPMICCSDFQKNVKAQTEDDINNHSNIGLLPENCGRTPQDRLLGGIRRRIYESPWMALIYYFDITDSNGVKIRMFECAGTIISSRYILTAAQCVHNETIAAIRVRVGDYNIRTSTDCEGEWPYYVCESHLQILHVEEAIIHEAYSTSPIIKNNIAILRVNNEIDFSFGNVKPICLPVWQELRNVTLIGEVATVTGWGNMQIGHLSSILQETTVPIGEPYCDESLRGYSDLQDDTSKTFCAGDSCNGHSGGLLMLFEEYKNNYRRIQYGIFSDSYYPCSSGSPALYTDVTKYVKWILDNMKE